MPSFSWARRAALSIVMVILVAAPALAYDDVPSESPYFYPIQYLRKSDVFKDTKLFKPNSSVSRAEFIGYLVKFNSPKFQRPQSLNLPYSDTQNNRWYASYLNEAIRIGILTGNEGKINPDRPISLLEALELLFHSRSIPIPRRYVGEMPYTDLAKNEAAQPLVMRSAELGLVSPQKSNFFGLNRTINRGDAATMIYKMDLVDLRDPVSLNTTSLDPDLQKIQNAWQIIQSNYVGREGLDNKTLSDSAIRAMVESLGDPYSVFMDAEQNQAFNDQLGGTFEGIGIFLELNTNKDIAIVSAIKGGPADIAGARGGDVLRKVDDFDVAGASLVDVVGHIKGPTGTVVKLTLERNGQSMVIPVTRQLVTVKPLEYEVIGGGKVMHVHLFTFNDTLVSDFQEVSEIIRQNATIKGIVLDVRNNPGGLVESAVGILGSFLPKNQVAVTFQFGSLSYGQQTSGASELASYPLVVLVDKGSASASEIVAGALKDNGVPLIGETTFGKGTAQELDSLGDGSSLKITVAKWFTPSGQSIDHKGITPTILVAPGTGSGSDPQLDRAVSEVLKSAH